MRTNQVLKIMYNNIGDICEKDLKIIMFINDVISNEWL